MRDVILITGQRFDLDSIKNRIHEGAFDVILEDDRLSIQDVVTRNLVQIERDHNLASYYDDQEGDVFKSVIADPAFYLITFKDINLLKRVLGMALNRADIFLDNDFGLIHTGQQFVNTFAQRPGWDWALD